MENKAEIILKALLQGQEIEFLGQTCVLAKEEDGIKNEHYQY